MRCLPLCRWVHFNLFLARPSSPTEFSLIGGAGAGSGVSLPASSIISSWLDRCNRRLSRLLLLSSLDAGSAAPLPDRLPLPPLSLRTRTSHAGTFDLSANSLGPAPDGAGCCEPVAAAAAALPPLLRQCSPRLPASHLIGSLWLWSGVAVAVALGWSISIAISSILAAAAAVVGLTSSGLFESGAHRIMPSVVAAAAVGVLMVARHLRDTFASCCLLVPTCLRAPFWSSRRPDTAGNMKSIRMSVCCRQQRLLDRSLPFASWPSPVVSVAVLVCWPAEARQPRQPGTDCRPAGPIL